MKTASLSTEQAPPISVPLRFFAIAPLFLLLAAWILAWGDDLSNPHSPALLAATHCITLGFMALVMLGAVQQILPVVIGSPMPAQRWVAWFSFLPLIVGTLSLAGGFLLHEPALLNLACWLLGLAFLTFIAASLISLSRATAQNASKNALWLAISALTLAVTLGSLLAHGYANGLPLNYPQLALAHIALALGGWVTMLIVGVSFQVVPMFQLTPNYPKWLSAGLPPALCAALLLFLCSRLLESAPLGYLAEALFWLLAVSFATITLKLQSQRRRRVADATLSFFRLGMISLLLAALFSLLAPFSPELFKMSAVVTFILGFALSVIHGMLYKIIPFLIWFHLFRGGIKKGVPNMKEIIPEAWMWRHLWLHFLTLLAALMTLYWKAAVWLLATGLALQGILLCFAIVTAITVYRRTLTGMEK
ncbi:MAG: hypothetical protein COS43_03500 [Gallionellales bacterium CG03_land_8_20_14_0_80_55_15]|nr:MAG: hypothetical protein COS43_03500 [Gallionellales bacterium CG03_land_8_20_14_0_80_55_15]PIX04713.1 MAG: hypothetical protein COZ77_05050 [Gallionellales bacterium CG_4_8_14_3_um_filter_54_18]PJC04383.1 MAG: hypothetical protein CO070_04340 [Gallionellales bacterium CG_4_9_14_0_8_um_filter_55_61]HCJ50400.1 hypothetical protein [Gallionella sp.]